MTLSLFAAKAKADLWTVQQQWQPEHELQYQQWLKTNAKTDMFSKQFLADGKTLNPYFGITTDCADTVYTLRILFSYENKLPWAIKNPANTKRLITQATKKFDDIPEGAERLKAFLTYLFDIVGTSSIRNDTYPISLNAIRPGVIISTSKINHHSWTIADVDTKGNPRLIYNSTVGKLSGSKLQQRRSWPNPYWVFQPEEQLSNPADPNSTKIKIPVYHADSYAGLRYWIPVSELLNDPKLLSDYSNDQFELDLADWKQTLQTKIATQKETIQEVVTRLLNDACDDIKQRITAVSEVQEYKKILQKALKMTPVELAQPININELEIFNDFMNTVDKPVNNQCLIAAKYDEHSTPSRDRRLFDAIMLARSYFVEGLRLHGTKAYSTAHLARFKKIFSYPEFDAVRERQAQKSTAINTNSICKVNVGQETLDLAEIKVRLFNNQLSPNPNYNRAGRWGNAALDSAQTLVNECSTYGETYPGYDLPKSEEQAHAEVKKTIGTLNIK